MRSEIRIVVIFHCSFIYDMCHLFRCVIYLSDVVRRELQQGFRNVEMRSAIIGDRRASQNCNGYDTNFHGGVNFKESIAKHGFKIGNGID